VNLELADLFFGRDDAELDIAEGGLLLAGFLPTPAYEAARKARKHLIIGRKGSGKSAICRTLAAQDEFELVTALVTPDALSADEIRRFELQGVESGMAKRMIWRYVLAVQIAKHLVAHAKAAHRKTPSVVNKLHTFLVDNGELDVSRSKIYESIKKLKASLKLQAFGVAVEVGSPSEGTHADCQLEVIERHIELAIKELACPVNHPRLLLLVDQLEDVWSEESESDSLVIGLLKAARAAGSRFSRVSCVVFLRSDIYELLRFADKDKYHGDEMRVDWSAERLRELVLARACASLGVKISEDRLWGEFFPGEVSGVPAWEYVVAHTLMRPRDIIHLCNLCRDTAEYNGHAIITEADVVEAVRLYSQWKIEDLPNEYLANYPFLDGLLSVFKDHGYIVTRAALNRRLSEALEVLAGRFPERTEALTTDNMLDVLYDIGFLGVRHNDHIVYASHHGGRIELTDTEFHIHPAFRPALRATCAAITQRFEPGQVRSLVRSKLASARGGGLLRGSAEHQLLLRAQRGVDRLLSELEDEYLPREVRQEVATNLLSVRRHLQDLRSTTSPDEVILQIDRIQTFLIELGARLENDGFAENHQTRYFIRSIHDLGRQLRHQVRSGIYQGSGGEGSGSE
jgi:hypothetical protein